MRIICIITLLYCSLFLQAQDKTIKGRVANSDGQPHVGVKVTSFNSPTKVETLTDNEGYFSLTIPKHTTYLVVGNPFDKNNSKTFNITELKKGLFNIIINSYINGNVWGLKNGVSLQHITVEAIGQNKTTKTEKNGYFKIENLDRSADVTLKISDGNKIWKTKEIVLPKGNHEKEYYSIILEQYISPLLASETDTLGITYLNSNTPKLDESSKINYISDINSIKKTKKGYKINPPKPSKTSNLLVEFSTAASLLKVGQLPKLQSTFAQGENDGGQMVWQGADKNQQFSWGPDISTLEYSNGAYPFDKNGALVAKGTGNGNAANAYNPTDFFRTGISFNNALTIKKMFQSIGILNVSLGQDRVNSPIPNSYQESYNGGIRLEKVQTGAFYSEFNIMAKTTKDRLMNNGASHARLFQSILTTPSTFDNANGMSRKEALHNSNSWLLTDGANRSYAPNEIFNPFGLVKNMPDRDKSSNVLLYAKTRYTKNRFESNTALSLSKQWDDRSIGVANYSQQIHNGRKEDFSNLNVTTNANYRLSKFSNHGFKLNGSYAFISAHNDVTRLNTKVMDRTRNQHEINYGTTYEKQNLFFEVNNKHYFSNTATNYTNLFPSFGAKYSLDNSFFYNKFNWRFMDYARFFGSTARSLGEAPLVYRNMAALTTNMSSSTALKSYYEDREILPFCNKMKPEIYFNNEIGMELVMWRNKLNFEINYFYNATDGMVAPAFNNSKFALENIGNIKNYGFLISANFNNQNGYGDNRMYTTIHANFSRTRNMVTSVSDNREAVQLSGFTNVGTFFKKDEPLGTIYGNTYQRDAAGSMIIGADGFPLVNNTMSKIGDPTPEFVINLSPNISWKRFDFNFNLMYSKGGDVWNGTRAYLDFLGMSESSAIDRTINEYIFSGVTQSGSLNNKVVNFYDPALPIDQNRWVRYGAAGVAEDYIEDASYLRLSDISLSYKLLVNSNDHFFENMTVGIHAHNLFQIANYKGVDPSSKLFGYATGNGLDLFNMPSIRKYSLSINLKF